MISLRHHYVAEEQLMADVHILRIDAVTEMVGLSRSQVWRLSKAHDFPLPLKLGAHARGWRSADVERWIKTREVAKPQE
jgi:prophage regulatory protein